ncbi:MAG: hypothetical protein LBL52_03060 [Rickettsiales bacterium]|jgi:palmitoyl transferase|nr:hypothetical protein [Rickettsiales bacterium]
MKKLLPAIALFAAVILASPARAYDGFWDMWLKKPGETWESPTSLDLTFPVHTWHNRFMYDESYWHLYNENPGGIGIGVSRIEGGLSSTLFAQAFRDSHWDWQGILAYSLLKQWRSPGGWFVGAGGVLTIQIRYDYNYWPIPLPLPMWEFGYKAVSIQQAYVPGWHNEGSVLFTWIKVAIPL